MYVTGTIYQNSEMNSKLYQNMSTQLGVVVSLDLILLNLCAVLAFNFKHNLSV